MREEATAGCAAGVVGTLIGFPLDSLKTRMQAGQAGAAPGMVSLGRKIVQEEGVGGFYRGVASPLAALTILNTLNFSSYANMRKYLEVDDRKLNNASGTQFEWRVPVAAGCVGPLASMISTPFELVKTQMVINNKAASHIDEGAIIASRPSSIRTALEIVRTHGLKSLYIAHGVNTTREIVFLSTYFTVYEHSKSSITHNLKAFGRNFMGLTERSLSDVSKVSIPVAGGFSGAIGWFISFPLDCVKSNIQGIPLAKMHTRGGALDVVKGLLASKGIKGLYSGVLPSITRAFLVSASRFSVYEGVLSLMRKQSFD